MTELLTAAGEGEFSAAARQTSKWVDHVLGPTYRQYRPGEAWSPAINLYEDQKHYCVVVDLAGVQPEEIDIRVDEGKMAVSGRRVAPELPSASGQVCMHLMEIDHGPFVRTLELPDDADVDTIDASYRCGYLWIKILKRT